MNTEEGMLTRIAIVLFATALAAEAADARRITLDEAQAEAAAASAANLAQLGVNAARYHREAIRADYFPKIDSMFVNLHFNKFMGQRIPVFGRTTELPLLDKDQTLV